MVTVIDIGDAIGAFALLAMVVAGCWVGAGAGWW